MERHAARFARYNVVASFANEASAGQAVRALKTCGVPRSVVSIDQRADERAEQRAEMQGEVEHMGGAGPSFAATSTQLRGAVSGAIAFCAIGVFLGFIAGLVWAYAVDSSLSVAMRVLLPVIGGGAAGSTAGFVAGGGLAPWVAAGNDTSRPGLEDRAMLAEWTVHVGVHTDDEDMAGRAVDAFADLVPVRLDLFDSEGTPLPPQHFHPRPADPPGRWWRRAEG